MRKLLLVLLLLIGFSAFAQTDGFIINEIDVDQFGVDRAEFVELLGPPDRELTGLSLVFFDGRTDRAYRLIELDGQSTGSDGLFVVCGDANRVTGCDLDIEPDFWFIQNGPDAVALYAQGELLDALVYGTSDAESATLLDLFGGEQADENANGARNTESIQRCGETIVVTAPTPGAANTCADESEAMDSIHAIQGGGGEVTERGPWTVEAIVTGDFQARDQLRGFFLQEEDHDVDGDPTTSEAVFVFCENCPVDVAVGDLVQVTGVASEFDDMSQLGARFAEDITVISSDNPLPTPVTLNLPVPDGMDINAYYEPFEGMLVTIPQALTATEYYQLGRYGQIVLSEGGRLPQFTHISEPSEDGYTAHLDTVARRRIILDDDDNFQNVDPIMHPLPGGLSADNPLRGGWTITDLTGVLHWSEAGSRDTDAWRIRPVVGQFDYSFDSTPNPRPETPPAVGGNFHVASFNVLNYFTTIHDGDNICGVDQAEPDNCRGADSEAELERQATKIVEAICAIDADVVGLMEIENNARESLEDLTERLNAVCGPYDFVDSGIIGGDAIKVGFIYKPDTTERVGDFAILDSTVDDRFNERRNRPALAQTFRQTSSGESLTVVVNHLKSKGSSCGTGDDSPRTGQANCAGTRTRAAEAMVDWLATDPTGSGEADVLVIGDLNSYRLEDPIRVFTDNGYTDLEYEFNGIAGYGYVFDGQWGYLDYALANESLMPQVTGASSWHINADEVNMLDYNDTIQDETEAPFHAKPPTNELYAPDAFRSSDHDPVVVGLSLGE